ncbi:MAG: hypothetical protein PHD70_01920 [Anaerostipes sp.]|jgi:archaellum biogenesis protein FlaJ (TadC family)|nr:hypothetical protein [Anaerostipes sp.]MDD3745215.1 hypothetical protein [Anaerostipes sp.]
MIKKLIAPILITIFLILYLIVYGTVVITYLPIPMAARIMLGIIPLALIGLMIYVLIERIKEIDSGEEDDLDKY